VGKDPLAVLIEKDGKVLIGDLEGFKDSVRILEKPGGWSGFHQPHPLPQKIFYLRDPLCRLRASSFSLKMLYSYFLQSKICH